MRKWDPWILGSMEADKDLHGIAAELLVIAITGVIPWAVIVINWRFVWRYYIKGETGSLIPIIGGVLGALVVWNVSTNPTVRRLWWIPLVIDCGSIPLLLMTVLFWVRRMLDR